MRNVMSCRLHPQVNGGTAEHVQSKLLNDSMLQLIQVQWGQGEGEFDVRLHSDAYKLRSRSAATEPHTS